MKKLALLGIFVGGVTDIVATNVLSIPLAIYLLMSSRLPHVPQDQAAVAFGAALHANAGVYAATLVVGLTGSVVGGYVAAWIAKHDELLNGALSAWLCVALGLYAAVAGKTLVAPTEHLFLIVVGIAAALLGGYLRLVQNRALPSSIRQADVV